MNLTHPALPLLMGVGMAAIISFTLAPILIRFATKRQWLDVPDNDRKTHGRKVPQLGGVALVIAYLLTSSFISAAFPPWLFFNASALMFFFIGLLDDRFHLRPGIKLLAQLFPVALVVYFGGIQIPALPGIEAGMIPIGIASGLLILYYTNAFNFIDGVDGLAAALGMVQAGVIGLAFLSLGAYGAAFVCFSIAGGLLGLLPFNRHPARLFLGDNGSLFLGFALIALTIWPMRLSFVYPSLATNAPHLSLLLLVNISLPMIDALRVFGYRLAQGKNPFKGDRQHVHHKLLDLGLSPRGLTILLVAVNLGLVGLTWTMRSLPWEIILGLVLLLYVLGYYLLHQKTRRMQQTA